jgi:hypothetical protein
MARVSGRLVQKRVYELTGLLYLKTGEARFFRLATRSVPVHASVGYARRVHLAAIFHAHFTLDSRTARKTLTPIPPVVLASMTALSGLGVHRI